MKRALIFILVITAPLFLLGAVWQASRYSALAAELKRLELSQDEWVQENRKLAAGISVLSSRERAAALAEALGLQKALPERRIRIILPAKAGSDG
jgi:cell division protein FtsL